MITVQLLGSKDSRIPTQYNFVAKNKTTQQVFGYSHPPGKSYIEGNFYPFEGEFVRLLETKLPESMRKLLDTGQVIRLERVSKTTPKPTPMPEELRQLRNELILDELTEGLRTMANEAAKEVIEAIRKRAKAVEPKVPPAGTLMLVWNSGHEYGRKYPRFSLGEVSDKGIKCSNNSIGQSAAYWENWEVATPEKLEAISRQLADRAAL